MVGKPADIDVREFIWFEENRAHIARHFVGPEDVEFVLANNPRFHLHRPGHSASHVMLGRDAKGRALYVAISLFESPNRWFVVTAWESRLVRRILAETEESQ